MSRPVEAIVLDLDGVLLRSMELHALAYQLVLRPWGVAAPTPDVLRMEGARSETILREFLTRAGHQVTDEQVEALADLKQRVFSGSGSPQLYAGAVDAVAALHARGFPLALATGTRRENLERLAKPVLAHLAHTVTQEDYTHDKPHPEPYLTAAQRLDIEPARCLVIENAPRGVASAQAAGMQVIAVTQTLPPEDLAAADRVVASIRDVPAAVPGRPGDPLPV